MGPNLSPLSIMGLRTIYFFFYLFTLKNSLELDNEKVMYF